MKKDITKLIRELFNDPQLLMNLGFSQRESQIFHNLIQGASITEISVKMSLPYYEVNNIKNKRFHLIPIFLQRKLDQLASIDVEGFHQKLLELNQQLSLSIDYFNRTRVYEVHELNLPKRVINSLVAQNIKSTDQLLQYNRKELLQIKNIGEPAIVEIDRELKRLHLYNDQAGTD